VQVSRPQLHANKLLLAMVVSIQARKALALLDHRNLMNLHDLRKSPLFQGLSDEELKHLMDMAEPVSLRAGDVLIRQGEPGDAAYVVIKGEFEVQKQTGQSLIKIDVRNPGDVVGEMALLSRAPRNATLIAKTDGEVLRIPKEAFETLLQSSTTAAMAVLHWVMSRLTQNESLLHQQEKMAALGTMSAGLAHELNNPAAAAQRSPLAHADPSNRKRSLPAGSNGLAGWFHPGSNTPLGLTSQAGCLGKDRSGGPGTELAGSERRGVGLGAGTGDGQFRLGGGSAGETQRRPPARVVHSFHSMAGYVLFDDGLALRGVANDRADLADRPRCEVVRVSRPGTLARSGRPRGVGEHASHHAA
jgi:CRP-like cAMP-binding protein